ncbi:rhomboid family intramembrane serine protease [Mucilaginibacter sp. KACC 22063]|uniref:rhomboid family intramembrane serine protease n=1 Tax=Mucilaginibacter sp. KACC 22063 TaxID=3025666 RepID=UPI0023668475|nr:rhomboid family intramembrane serine protease [Mucilaginibacter sp. KACC 22063]WDF55196.1 rhomboid family intramembrane serine protease [Mucilaginibacter sp. KACC 22063]
MLEIINAAPVASAIFAITLVLSLLAFYNEDLYHRMLLQPYDVYRGKRVYTVITSGLIHKDWGHLFFNMLSFFFFAFPLEINYIGHWQFGVLYVVSLILSDMPSVVKHKDDIWYRSLGASGAISAVIFSFILFNPLTKLYIMFIPIGIYAIIFGVLYLIYSAYASKNSHDAINHDAHFFGAISGIVITIILNHQAINIFLQQLGIGG